MRYPLDSSGRLRHHTGIVSKGKKFAHPGIFYTEGDFGRMKAMIAAGARLRAIVVGK